MQCPRCGAEVKDVDRCCLRCGAPNYNNSLNSEYLKKYGNKKEYKKATSFGFKERNQKRKRLIYFIICLMVIVLVIVLGLIIFVK